MVTLAIFLSQSEESPLVKNDHCNDGRDDNGPAHRKVISLPPRCRAKSPPVDVPSSGDETHFPSARNPRVRPDGYPPYIHRTEYVFASNMNFRSVQRVVFILTLLLNYPYLLQFGALTFQRTNHAKIFLAPQSE